MAFGHASRPTRKYTYGVRETVPGENKQRFAGHDEAVEQMFKANRMRNALVAIERKRREDSLAILLQSFPDLEQLRIEAERLTAELDAARVQLKANNSHERRLVSDPALVEQIKTLASKRLIASKSYTVRKREAYADSAVKERLAANDKKANDAKSLARADAVVDGLYWATASHVMTRVKTSGPPPRFARFNGEGLIAIQVQRKPDTTSEKVPVLDSKGNPRIHPRSGKPMTAHATGLPFRAANAFSGNTLLRIERVSENEAKKPRLHAKVHFRVASDDKGNPIWATLPTVIHRPLPPEAEIKWAYLSRTKIGTHYRWEVQFDMAQDKWPERVKTASGTVAISLGWRIIDGNLRVAYWIGDDGKEGEISIPADRLARWQWCEDLQAIRDRLFNQHKEELLQWVANGNLPDAFLERVAALPQWRSPSRLAVLMNWWRLKENRLPGDDKIFEALEGSSMTVGDRIQYTGGRKQDKHLYDWQENQRANCRGWRQWFYRNAAIELSKRYRRVVVGMIDWAELGKSAEPEFANKDVNKSNKGIASVCQLRDAMTLYMDEVQVSAVGVVVDCSRCHGRCPDPGSRRFIRCVRCGGENVDRARNAANNLLARGLAAIASDDAARGSTPAPRELQGFVSTG